MAKLNFRQGLVRYPSLSDGGPFLVANGSRVDISAAVNTIPVQATIAHFDQNYLFQESKPSINAWGTGTNPNVGSLGPNNNAPFTNTGTRYLYWDIDFKTGITSYDYTTVAPASGPNEPTSPTQDLHWYDTTNFVMKVRSGNQWLEKLRVFAATYTNTTLTIKLLGTQIGVSAVSAYAGYILFDDSNKPLQRFSKDRKGVFIHTEMPLASQWNSGGGIANFRLEALMFSAKAVEPIAAFYAVALSGPGKIALARNTVPTMPAVGIASEDMSTGEIRQFVPYGFVENIAWTWPVTTSTPAGTPLFVGSSGQLVTSPPQTNSLQQIGYIVDAVTIYVQPQTVIFYG